MHLVFFLGGVKKTGARQLKGTSIKLIFDAMQQTRPNEMNRNALQIFVDDIMIVK